MSEYPKRSPVDGPTHVDNSMVRLKGVLLLMGAASHIHLASNGNL
jgi:hypothetical protein